MILRRQNKQRQLERLFELYEQGMYRIAFAILHDEGQAEDAVMAAFERIVRQEGIPPRTDSDDARRLCGTIVKSCAIDIYRKNARTRQREVTYGESFLEPANLEAAQNAEGSNLADGEVWEAVDELPHAYREVIVERFANDLTAREAAEKLETTEGNIRVRTHRALEMLRARKGGLA